MSFDKQVEQLARALSKAQRAAVERAFETQTGLQHTGGIATGRVLYRLGLVTYRGDLLPLGLAVRQHLQEQANVR
jgi:hypothetical protein